MLICHFKDNVNNGKLSNNDQLLVVFFVCVFLRGRGHGEGEETAALAGKNIELNYSGELCLT